LQKKITGLVQVGRLSAAAVALETLQKSIEGGGHQLREADTLTEAQVRTHLASLHPAASPLDELPPPGPNEAPQALVDNVRGALLSLNVNSASGCSGWSNGVLRTTAATGSADDQTRFFEHLTVVFNKLLSGTYPDAVKVFWSDSRSVLIPKEDPGSFRPIGIGESLYRLAARAAHRRVGQAVGALLQPIQLGSGTPGGVEIAAVCTALGLERNLVDPDFATLSLDVKNAFNCIRRSHIFHGLVRHCPSLIPFFRWRYGGETVLRWHTGAVVGSCSTGCTQGDPLATLFFSVAVDGLYRELADALREEEERLFLTEQGRAADADMTADERRRLESSAGAIIAIVDDVSITGRTAAVCSVAERVAGIYEGHELGLNLQKCWILTGEGAPRLDPPAGIAVRADGGKVLGRPIGTLDYQREWIRRKVAAPVPHRALARLPCRVQLSLIRSVYNSKFDYLAKVVSPDVADEALRGYDAAIEQALWNLDAATDREDLRTLRALPFHLGGLSIPCLVGPRGTRNRRVTRTRTGEWLRLNLPHLHAAFINPTVQQRMFGEVEAPLAAANEDEGEATVWTPLEEMQRATKLEVLNAEANSMRALHLQLMTVGREANAARLLSASVKGTAKWMTCSWAPGTQAALFRDITFREALRCRLLSAFVPPGVGRAERSCGCVGVDLAVLPCYPAICPYTKRYALARHDAVRNRLARFLRSTHPAAEVVVEPTNVPAPGAPPMQEHRPDISFTMDGITRHIDVSVVDPAARCYLDAVASSANEQGSAAAQMEESKRVVYQGTRYADHLIPFVLECTGRLGGSAMEFLDAFCHTATPSQRSALLADFSSTLAMNLGEMSAALRKRLQGARRPP